MIDDKKEMRNKGRTCARRGPRRCGSSSGARQVPAASGKQGTEGCPSQSPLYECVCLCLSLWLSVVDSCGYRA